MPCKETILLPPTWTTTKAHPPLSPTSRSQSQNAVASTWIQLEGKQQFLWTSHQAWSTWPRWEADTSPQMLLRLPHLFTESGWLLLPCVLTGNDSSTNRDIKQLYMTWCVNTLVKDHWPLSSSVLENVFWTEESWSLACHRLPHSNDNRHIQVLALASPQNMFLSPCCFMHGERVASWAACWDAAFDCVL